MVAKVEKFVSVLKDFIEKGMPSPEEFIVFYDAVNKQWLLELVWGDASIVFNENGDAVDGAMVLSYSDGDFEVFEFEYLDKINWEGTFGKDRLRIIVGLADGEVREQWRID